MAILVAYIDSPEGNAALERALHVTRTHGSELVVLNVARGEAVLEPKRLHDELAAVLTKRLDDSGVNYTLRRAVIPLPVADAILQIVEEMSPEMLVIGLRKRSATGKFLFGSTASRILLEAPCDVLAVKAVPVR